MGHVRLEKINRVDRTFRHYGYRIAPGLFGASCLIAEWGRIGQTPQTRQLGDGDEAALWRQAIESPSVGAVGRLKRGYRLVSFEGPTYARSMIDRLETKSGPRDRRDAQLTIAYEALSHLEPLAPLLANPEDGGALLRVLRLGDAQRHQRRRARTECPLFDRLLGHAGEPEAADPRDDSRRAVRIVVEILLRDDPHALSAVRRALIIPRRIDQTNVVHLLPDGARALTSASLYQFFCRDRELLDFAERLTGDKIRTMGDLIKLSPDALRTLYGLPDGTIAKIEKICGSFELWLDMGRLTYGEAARAS